MPFAPKLSDVTGKVGIVKIACQADSEQSGCPDSDVTIPGEITIDLEGEEHSSHPKGKGRLVCVVAPDQVDCLCAVVGHYHFFEEPPKHETTAIDRFGIVESPGMIELREQASCSLDGASDQLREETDVSKEREEIPTGCNATLIDINGIAQGLECVETDSNGQENPQRGPMKVQSEAFQQDLQIVNKEIVVFEESKDGQVDQYIGDRDCSLLGSFSFQSLNQPTTLVTEERGEDDEQQKTPVPPSIEQVAGDHQEEVLRLGLFKHKPVEQKHNGKEQHKCQ